MLAAAYHRSPAVGPAQTAEAMRPEAAPAEQSRALPLCPKSRSSCLTMVLSCHSWLLCCIYLVKGNITAKSRRIKDIWTLLKRRN